MDTLSLHTLGVIKDATELRKMMAGEEYDALVRAEIEKYKPYWKPVIAVYVDN